MQWIGEWMLRSTPSQDWRLLLTRSADYRFQLSFYRNMVIHLFISEAIVAAAMYTRIKQGGGPALQVVPYGALFEQVDFLSSVSHTVSPFTRKSILTSSSSSVGNSSFHPKASKPICNAPSLASSLTASSPSTEVTKTLVKSSLYNCPPWKETLEERISTFIVSSFGRLLKEVGLPAWR